METDGFLFTHLANLKREIIPERDHQLSLDNFIEISFLEIYYFQINLL